MALNRIGRRVTKTVYDVLYYDENNERHSVQLELFGSYEPETAQKKLRKMTGFNRLIVTDVISSEKFYASMTLEEFVKNADIKAVKE